jgi:hypothetical protein
MPCSLCPKTRALGCTTAGFSVPVDTCSVLHGIDLTIASGDDKATLEREIDMVQMLLDEQPDSKCRCAVVLHLYLTLLSLFVM